MPSFECKVRISPEAGVGEPSAADADADAAESSNMSGECCVLEQCADYGG